MGEQQDPELGFKHDPHESAFADLVYHTAQRAWRARYWFSHMGAKLRKVRPQEVFENRQLTAASAVQTAVTNICNAKCVFCAYPKAIKSGTLQTGVMPFETFKKAIDDGRR